MGRETAKVGMHEEFLRPARAWVQCNTTLFDTVCETLDLDKNVKDLNTLQMIDENNGMALHDLISFRLREIKSTDMDLAHIVKLLLWIIHIIEGIPGQLVRRHGLSKSTSTTNRRSI